MLKFKSTVLASLLFVVAGSAMANNFRAADQVYVPAFAGNLQGAAGAVFDQDVTISNLSADRVIVDVALIQAGQGGDANATAPSATKRLEVLRPGERRTYVKFTSSGLGLGNTSVNGFLVFFACKENGNCSDCGDPNQAGNCRNISVETRGYTTGTCIQTSGNLPCSFGNDYPGMPWYSYGSQLSTSGLNKIVISNVQNTGARGLSGFRTNIGVVNASQYSSTTLRITVRREDGAEIGHTDFALGPLGRGQTDVVNFAGGSFTGSGFVEVEQIGVTPTANAASNGCSDGCPGFFAYGVTLDNVSNDPTLLESQFPTALDSNQIGVCFPQKAARRSANRR